MLQLLSPFWLVALSGVLIPVLIHLWNKKPGRTIKVGSIRWLEAAASKRLNSMRLHDWLLLLLRMAIVALVALILTQPQWLQPTPPPAKRQVLIGSAVFASQALLKIKPTVDSLRKQGYELRLFSPGFPSISEPDWTNAPQPLANTNTAPIGPDYWTLLQALGQQPPSPGEAWIFTDGQLRHFRGERPGVSFPFTWISLPLAETTQWLQEAFVNSSDSLTLVVGSSDAEGTHFRPIRLPLPSQNAVLPVPELTETANAPVKFIKEDKNAFVEWKNDQLAVQSDTQRIVFFYDEGRKEEVRYLQAALRAWTDFTERNAELMVTSQLPDPKQSFDWLFWLSDQEVPTTVLQQLANGLQLVKEAATGDNKGVSAQLFIPGIPSPFALYRQTDGQRQSIGSTLWQDNVGRPMLSFLREGKGGLYTFYSRFDPKWNTVPESGYFPQIIGQLLHPPLTLAVIQDRREIDERQIVPSRTPEEPRKKSWPLTMDLRVALGGLALLLLALERGFVRMKTKTVNYPNKAKELV